MGYISSSYLDDERMVQATISLVEEVKKIFSAVEIYEILYEVGSSIINGKRLFIIVDDDIYEAIEIGEIQ